MPKVVLIPVDPLDDIEKLALRVGAAAGGVELIEKDWHFVFAETDSSVAVPAAAFDRLVAEGYLDGCGRVTAKGRNAARTLIGGPLP